MLHSLLPHVGINRGFGAFPNHAANYGWTAGYNPDVWVFPDADGDGNPRDFDMTGSFVMPVSFGNNVNPTVAIEWSANETTGSVRWQFGYKVVSGENAESLDLDLEADFTEAFGQIDQAAPSSPKLRRHIQVPLDDTLISFGDRIFWRLRRRGSVDTMPGSALLFGLYLNDDS